MIELVPWSDRKFEFDQSVATFPFVLERLRGAPARATELVKGVSEDALSIRVKCKWSIKENIGHLGDSQELETKRLAEFLARAAVMSTADMTNRKTEAARHNEILIASVLDYFHSRRLEWVRELESLTDEELLLTSLHPRLRQKMRLLDWLVFVADHDDHHLARISQLIKCRRH